MGTQRGLRLETIKIKRLVSLQKIFIGFANFYWRSIQGFSRIAISLTTMFRTTRSSIASASKEEVRRKQKVVERRLVVLVLELTMVKVLVGLSIKWYFSPPLIVIHMVCVWGIYSDTDMLFFTFNSADIRFVSKGLLGYRQPSGWNSLVRKNVW